MVTADPARTPTFTPFADSNWFFFATGGPACAGRVCIDPGPDVAELRLEPRRHPGRDRLDLDRHGRTGRREQRHRHDDLVGPHGPAADDDASARTPGRLHARRPGPGRGSHRVRRPGRRQEGGGLPNPGAGLQAAERPVRSVRHGRPQGLPPGRWQAGRPPTTRPMRPARARSRTGRTSATRWRPRSRGCSRPPRSVVRRSASSRLNPSLARHSPSSIRCRPPPAEAPGTTPDEKTRSRFGGTSSCAGHAWLGAFRHHEWPIGTGQDGDRQYDRREPWWLQLNTARLRREWRDRLRSCTHPSSSSFPGFAADLSSPSRPRRARQPPRTPAAGHRTRSLSRARRAGMPSDRASARLHTRRKPGRRTDRATPPGERGRSSDRPRFMSALAECPAYRTLQAN